MATTTFEFKNGDVVLTTTGRPSLLEDVDKLAQDVEQHLGQTEYPGAALETIIGRLDDSFTVRAQISRQIRASVNAIRQLQNQYHSEDRNAGERISRVSKLLTSQTSQNGRPNKTSYAFVVSVDSDEIPDAVSIAGEVTGA